VIQIDRLNLENKEPVHDTRANHAMHSTIAQLSLSLSLWCFVKHKTFHSSRPYLKFNSPNGRSNPLNIKVLISSVFHNCCNGYHNRCNIYTTVAINMTYLLYVLLLDNKDNISSLQIYDFS
jgi:hypothetical protein